MSAISPRQIFHTLLDLLGKEAGAVSVLPRLLTRVAEVETGCQLDWDITDTPLGLPNWTWTWQCCTCTAGIRTRLGLFGLDSAAFAAGAALAGVSPLKAGIADPRIYIPAAWAYLRDIERKIPRTGYNDSAIRTTIAYKLTGCSTADLPRYLAWIDQSSKIPDSTFTSWSQMYKSGANESIFATPIVPNPKPDTNQGSGAGSYDPAALQNPNGGFSLVTALSIAASLAGIGWFALHIHDRQTATKPVRRRKG